jgi:DNA-binding MarR family transcriptional regulator
MARHPTSLDGSTPDCLYEYNNCMPSSTARPDVDLGELANAVLTASRVLVAVAARSLAENEEDVSLPQYRALVVLGARGPQRPVDLAEALGIDPSSATRLCDRLVRKRLISRRRKGADRREVRLELSRKGVLLLDAITRRRRQEIERILRAVPEGRRPGLVDAFDAFSAAAGEVPDARWPRSWDL